VPDSVRYRTDKSRPLYAYMEALSAMRADPAFRDLLSMRELEARGIVDANAFASAFEQFARDPSANPWDWGTLWGAITGEAYVRWFAAFRAGVPKAKTPHLATPASS
ncbi:MAG: hypothetical protein ACREJ3_02390, partial [Polyangiaceae bacterium]